MDMKVQLHMLLASFGLQESDLRLHTKAVKAKIERRRAAYHDNQAHEEKNTQVRMWRWKLRNNALARAEAWLKS